jgi:hypothetical protein
MVKMSQIPPTEFRRPLQVQFVGEEGVDVGGVRKEFFLLMMRQLLDPGYGMFLQLPSRVLYFNPDSLESIIQFQLIGALIALVGGGAAVAGNGAAGADRNRPCTTRSFWTWLWRKLLGLPGPSGLDDLEDLGAHAGARDGG